jgi:hypothetical protein
VNCHRNKALTDIFVELVDEGILRRLGFGPLRFVFGSGSRILSVSRQRNKALTDIFAELLMRVTF